MPVSVSVSAPVLPVSVTSETAVSPIAWKRVIGVKAGPRPLVVWISDASTDAGVEHRTFDDDYVRLASRAFRVVRITRDAARADPFLAQYARSEAALVVFAPDLTHGAETYGPSLDARTAFAAMRTSARAYLGMDLDAAVSRAKALIADEHALAGQRATLVRTVPADAVRVAELDRRLAAIHAEMDVVFRPQAQPAR